MLSALIGLSLLLQAEPSQAAQGQAVPAQTVPAQTVPAQTVPAQAAATVAPQTPPSQSPPSQSPPTQSPPTASPSGETVRLTAGTPLEVELVAPLSSATSHLGDKFALRLAKPISSGGVEVVAAGATGEGEVIDAAHAGMAGGAGKLILSGRRLDLNGHTVRIRGLTMMGGGKSRVDLASGLLFVPYVGLAAGLIKGGEVEIPAGARYTAKLAEDIDLQINPPKQSEGKTQ